MVPGSPGHTQNKVSKNSPAETRESMTACGESEEKRHILSTLRIPRYPGIATCETSVFYDFKTSGTHAIEPLLINFSKTIPGYPGTVLVL